MSLPKYTVGMVMCNLPVCAVCHHIRTLRKVAQTVGSFKLKV